MTMTRSGPIVGRLLASTAVIATTLFVAPWPVVAEETPIFPQAEASAYLPTTDKSDPLIEQLDQATEGSWEAQFAVLSQKMREAFPDDFAESRVDLGQSSGAISFSGTPPQGAEELSLELSGVRLAADRGYTERGLEQASLDLLKFASTRLDSRFEATTYFDSTDNSLHVEFATIDPGTVDATAGIQLSHDLQNELTLADSVGNVPVIVNYIPAPVEDTSEAWVAG